jgi:hypothetical protein
MPERAPELGMIIYRGVDSVVWASLIAEIPELKPRGEKGYKRLY